MQFASAGGQFLRSAATATARAAIAISLVKMTRMVSPARTGTMIPAARSSRTATISCANCKASA